ncbi:S41 family peptidase [Paucibacter sp. APW11]|uniref:S41 family peptidase n=1 Tax=Roseateles aquae TaxID=3077235 RepID=A0ABU3PDJ5_9BURK|nr:S41 family peptidase [Paucibacter sp. APW11]MDT9000632.1 S41 family peptidase [Paucibacter sp. APW11]
MKAQRLQRTADRLMLGFGLLVLALLGVLPFVSRLDPEVPDPGAAVREVATLLRAHALNAGKVNWDAALNQAQATAASSGRQSALDRALQQLVAALQDGHSQYLSSNAAKAYQAPASAGGLSEPTFRVLPAQAGEAPVVELLSFLSDNPSVGEQQSKALAQALLAVSASQPCGLIVDLTQHHGGNMWPALMGLEALLPTGPLAYVVKADGSREPITVPPLNGASAALATKQPVHALAVLIGPGTASSGEFIAAALQAHPKTRSFGMPSAGLTTGNQLFELKHSGGLLAVAVSKLAGLDGRVIAGAIEPDVRVDEAQARAAAQAWVAGACGAEKGAGPSAQR